MPKAFKMLGIGLRYGYRMVDEGKIPTYEIGEEKRVPLAWIERTLGVQPKDDVA